MQAAGPLAAVGSIVKSVGMIQAGRHAKAVGDRNAMMTERDAIAQESALREDVRKQMGQQLVAQGGSGFQMGTGSFTDQLLESQVNGMLDALTLRRRAASEAQALRVQGKQQRREGYFGAASTMLSAAKDYAAAGA